MRPVGWSVTIGRFKEGYTEYMVLSGSSSAAVRKAMIEHRKTKMEDRDIRLGHLALRIEISRTHKKELDEWQEKGNKLLK